MLRVIKWNIKCCDGRMFRRFANSSMAMGCHNYSMASNSTQVYIYQKLACRSVIRVAGKDCSNFLQGLITNDMHHFADNKKGSVYAMMLNQQGRVLYDLIIYAQRAKNGDVSYLMECDSTVLPDICKHLKMYRVRKKVDIVPLEGQLCVWSIFKHPEALMLEGNIAPVKQAALLSTLDQASGQGGKVDEINVEVKMDIDHVHAHTKDPRLASLGWRLVLSEGTVPEDIVVNQNIGAVKEEFYRTLRYRLGIGEGVNDLPPASCFPLECNVDYLHGVSFHKGCYIGQELTARIHHTGVVRKRLLPMVFEGSDSTNEFDPKTSSVINEDGKNVGKFLGHQENFGLGLLRIQECIYSKKKLRLEGLQWSSGFTTFKPFWWPIEAPKESPTATKTS